MSDIAAFFRDGFVGPIKVLTPSQCTLVLQHHRRGNNSSSLEWEKGWALTDRFFYDVATLPALLARLRSLIGDDILLWGVSLIEKSPAQIHPWHTDIESSASDSRFISVWIGLENTSRESALKVISRSQSFGATIQQVQHENGRRRGEASDDQVLAWARQRDQLAACTQPEMADGDAIIFDGRLWHGTNNLRREGVRSALLLQYATADTPVLMPDFSQLEWPLRFTDRRIPSIIVSGRAINAVNRLMPPPRLDLNEPSEFLVEDPSR
jgi:hypothetical protein